MELLRVSKLCHQVGQAYCVNTPAVAADRRRHPAEPHRRDQRHAGVRHEQAALRSAAAAGRGRT